MCNGNKFGNYIPKRGKLGNSFQKRVKHKKYGKNYCYKVIKLTYILAKDF